MNRVRTAIKEIYEQIGEYEYNRINPYKRMIASIRTKYPNAVITKSTTTVVPFSTDNESVLIPMLAIHYITD